MNLHDLAIARRPNGAAAHRPAAPARAPPALQRQLADHPHARVCLGIRPESLRLCAPGSANCFPAQIVTIERMGNEELLHCELADLRFVLRMASLPDWSRASAKAFIWHSI